LFCVAAWAAGCELPPEQAAPPLPDLLPAPSPPPRDMGQPDAAPADLAPPPHDLLHPVLDGNWLPLDGGGALASLIFTVTDGDTHLPTPSRVIFRPPPGAGFADSILNGPWVVNSPNSRTGAIVAPGVVGSPEGVLLQSGQGVVPVPAGQYDLFITRGPEYEAVTLHVALQPGEVMPVNAELDRSVDTRGWLAADLHVHTRSSYDSTMPLDRRVISMTTGAVELIVTTDHNVATDLQPIADALGYTGDVVGTLIGNEFNFAYGHGGAYPVPFDANKPNGGAPPWTDCRTDPTGIDCTPDAQAFAIMHAMIPGQTVVTVNHPWWGGGDLGWFTNMGWGAGTANPLPAPLAQAGSFDAIEVLNGYWTRDDVLSYVVADWFYLTSQGFRVAALGSSDTHRINWVRAGWPRSWLRLPNDRPGDTTGALFADAIRNQRAIASTGPFALLTVDGAQIGDTVVPQTAGQVTVGITVDAPSWMKVDTVRLYMNGVEKERLDVVPGQRPVLQTQLVETLSADAWFVLQASGATPLPGDVVGEYASSSGWQMTPWVITNPIYVDATGDGFQPPPWQAGSGMPTFQPSPDWRPFRAPTTGVTPLPESCSPTESEPPLYAPRAPERDLMPLLYP
jgi:hypothetical protein